MNNQCEKIKRINDLLTQDDIIKKENHKDNMKIEIELTKEQIELFKKWLIYTVLFNHELPGIIFGEIGECRSVYNLIIKMDNDANPNEEDYVEYMKKISKEYFGCLPEWSEHWY